MMAPYSVLRALVLGLAMSVAAPVLAADLPPSGDTGFDPASIADFVQSESAGDADSYGVTADQYARRNFLYRLGNQFRVIGAIDPRQLESSFAPGNQAVLAGLMDSKASRRAPGIWRYFFRQSLIYAGRVDAPISRVKIGRAHV